MLLKDLLMSKKESFAVAAEYCGRCITYHALFRRVEKMAALMRKLNITRKPAVIFLNNSIDYIAAFFSATMADNVIVPVSVTSTQTDIISIVEYCRPDMFITAERYGAALNKILAQCPFKIYILMVDTGKVEKSGGSTETMNNDFDTAAAASEDDVALLLHTSGTTSNPKRVMLTHKNLISNAASVAAILKIDESSRTLLVLPLFLASGISQMITHLYAGAAIVIMDGPFLASTVLARMQKDKVTNFFGVPFMLSTITEFSKARMFDISSVRFMCFGGGPVPDEAIRTFMDMFPNIGFSEMYGQTEASPRISHLLPEDSRKKPGSVGRPIPGVSVKIIDSAGNEVPRGVVGELIAQGDNIMKGYYRNAGETGKVLRNGWLYTGDLAKMDEDGYIYIAGRMKNVIIYCGFNIYPEEVEEVLLSHPGVKEAYVYGAEDKLAGQVPVAKAVLKDYVRLTAAELIEYCFSRLERFKVPCEIFLVDHIDKTATGKVRRGFA